jgi:uncharacterized protein (DUF1501 family)
MHPESVNKRVDEPVESSIGLGRPLSRRGFVTKGLALVGLGTVLPSAFVRAAFAEGTPPGVSAKRRVLVVVQLGGGNDGLNTVIPYTDGLYYDARPRIALNAEAALHLDSHVALHPEMKGIKALYDNGQVAVIQGVGYPDPSRSHFRSMEIWHTASTAENVRTGWLGRLLDATHHEQDALWRAANIGSELPESFRANNSFVPSIGSVQTYGLATDPAARGQSMRRITDWVRLYASQAALGGALALVSKTGEDAYQSTLDLKAASSAYQPLATYPGNALASALRTSAQIITSNLGTGICYVTTGGFDSHAGQASSQPRLLQAVSESVAAFYADLTARGIDQDVVTLVWTEFGRRVRENGSAGTDHGTATPVFIIGGGVKGGLYGETPSLRDLDDNGDLKFNTDFRSVYGTLLARWFGTDPRDVLGTAFPELPLFA